tara:strand:- start:353 stop:514 length:162 start_codon:yes stop_codon:yes gene_type:complete
MGLVILASVMLVTNIFTVYFTFSTWYGQRKQKKLIPYTIDESGKFHFELEEEE